MALFSKFGAILRQTASRNLLSEPCVTKPSILQAIRCMSSMASSKLFVGGLSYATDDFQLKEAFAKYGEVLEARVIVDRETGRSRGFGFITFTSTEEASSAIQGMDGQPLHGRNVRVNYATEKTRGGFGGGYRSNYGSSGGAYGDNYGGSNYGSPGGGNYGPPGGNYGPSGGNYGPSGGNYGPPSGNFGDGNYGPPAGGSYDSGSYGNVRGTDYGNSPEFGAGRQYTGGNTYNSGGGGGGSASSGSGFEGNPDFSFGSGDPMDADVTDKIDESMGGDEESDIVDGNYRDNDDGDFAKRA